jgi:hypothetical protein
MSNQPVNSSCYTAAGFAVVDPESSQAESSKSSWNFQFPSLSACASSIRRFTSSACSSISSLGNSLYWGFYNIKASIFSRDQMMYSQGQITGENTAGDDRSVNIPEKGSFKAGSVLCNQLTTSLYASVVSEATTFDGPELRGVKQFLTDINRCESFSIVDESGTKNVINRPDSTEPRVGRTHAQDAANKLRIFTGGDESFQNAMLSICNQTIGNTFNYTLKSGVDDTLRAHTGIGFPNPSTTTQDLHSDQSYELKRVSGQTGLSSEGSDKKSNTNNVLPDHFILTVKQKGNTNCFILRNQDPVGLTEDNKSDAANRIISLKKNVAFEDSISITITPNKDFDTKTEIPFLLKVTDFTNSYQLAVSNEGSNS